MLGFFHLDSRFLNEDESGVVWAAAAVAASLDEELERAEIGVLGIRVLARDVGMD